jgi:glyceraldehyde 3-phosphate dehydrogenase
MPLISLKRDLVENQGKLDSALRWNCDKHFSYSIHLFSMFLWLHILSSTIFILFCHQMTTSGSTSLFSCLSACTKYNKIQGNNNVNINLFIESLDGLEYSSDSLFERQLHLLVQCQLYPIDKMVNVSVNGFGCMGCLVTRAAICSPLGIVETVATNDPFIDLNYMLYMFQYDFTHSKFNGTVKAKNGKLVINGKPITIFQERDSTNIKWDDAGAEYVVESTGVFTTMKKAGAHLKGGAKSVFISAPSANAPMFVMAVNHEKYDNLLKTVSNASCTTNCLAPLAKAIHGNFGNVEGLKTMVHAITATQKTEWPLWKAVVLWPWGCPEHHPSIHWWCQDCGQGQPIAEQEAQWHGLPFSYPQCIHCGPECLLQKPVKYDDIKKVVKQACEGPLKGILGYTEDQVVSCDLNSNSHTSNFDAGAGIALNDNFLKLISWYDIEFSYSNRVVDLLANITSKE